MLPVFKTKLKYKLKAQLILEACGEIQHMQMTTSVDTRQTQYNFSCAHPALLNLPTKLLLVDRNSQMENSVAKLSCILKLMVLHSLQ